MKDYKNFECPRWEDLPDTGLRSSETIKYIEKNIEMIVIDKPVITATMIQNYRRWGLLSNTEGRLYFREDIARLFVISIYKQIISIESIKIGFDLMLKQMSVDKSYNSFAEVLSNSIQSISKSIDKDGNLTIQERVINNKEVGLSAIGYAYGMKLLGYLIIKENGIKEMRGKLNG